MIIKALRNLLIVIFVIALVYLWAWYESSLMSGQYYTEAVKKYTEGDYISALKGEQKVKEDKSGYYFGGGFQQVDLFISGTMIKKTTGRRLGSPFAGSTNSMNAGMV